MAGTDIDGPAMPPPDGISNFDDPPNRNIIGQVVLPLCFAFTTLAVFLRTYARLFCIKRIGVPDILMIIAFGCYVVEIYLGYRLRFDAGFYVHTWDIRQGEMATIQFPLFLSGSFYIGAVSTIKAAMLLDWARICSLDGPRVGFSWLCYGVLGASTVFYIIILFVMNFACVPVRKMWDPLFNGGSCAFDTNAVYISLAAVSFSIDIILLLLPQRIIWGLNMSRRTKAGLSVLFAIGIFGCVAAGFRLGAEVTYAKSGDVIYNSASVTLWGLGEMTCMFLVFGIPSVTQVAKNIRLPNRVSCLLQCLGGLIYQRPGSRHSSGVQSQWHGSNMIIKSAGGRTSHPPYQKIHSRTRSAILTTINSTKTPKVSESMEHLKEHGLQYRTPPPGPGEILRTTEFRTDEEYGGQERGRIECDEYGRQHPWAKDRVVCPIIDS
ncbi:hypothetical protein M426DRAFT_173895 [Hypoxylon sp. CI-4A]|nr:hypothetical protein M426DRAFT_173895 [Hypoxylon sp. CI-4A]